MQSEHEVQQYSLGEELCGSRSLLYVFRRRLLRGYVIWVLLMFDLRYSNPAAAGRWAMAEVYSTPRFGATQQKAALTATSDQSANSMG